MKTIEDFLKKLETDNGVEFADTIKIIAGNYNDHLPFEFCTDNQSAFTNGAVENAAGANEGSCKIFAFAKLNDLTKEETLKLFGHHYDDVLKTPNDTDHANIRNFMTYGWEGIKFDKSPWQILS